jgi:hypothetical protein
MPATASWLLHLDEIRSMLSEVTLPVIDRAVIESVFGLRRRQAIELLNQLGGAYKSGKTLLIERTRLIAELDRIAAGGEYRQEQARHEKLTAALARFQRTRRAQEVRIEVSPDVFGTRVAGLPAAVRLQAGKLEVQFSGCQDLVGKLFSVAQAALNDFDAFRNLSDGTNNRRE